MMHEIPLYENERIDDLQFAGLHIIQSSQAFRFSMDSVLLADFVSVIPHCRVCDLGTGTGIIPLLLFGRENTIQCDAVEIQPDAAERAMRSVKLNHAEQQIEIHQGDLKEIKALLPHARYQLVTCNPPYAATGAAIPSPKQAIQGARQEETCTFQDVAAAANWLLPDHGKFCFMLPVCRLSEVITTLKPLRIEIKRIRFVHSVAQKEARLMLVEAMKGVSSGVRVMPPLIIKNDDGTDTEEIKRIYHQL